jgi:putative ABC transport system ATP-binding protein
MRSTRSRLSRSVLCRKRNPGDPIVTEKVGALIEARKLTKAYGSGNARVEALRGFDLTIAPGEFVAVMGSSGSGKSTLLHLLAGLDRPTSGSLRVGEHDLCLAGEDELALLRRRLIGVVFQAFNLLDMLSAEENVALPLAIGGTRKLRAEKRAAEALDRVGLAHRRRHLPGELSGGEQQRVAIARALVIEPLVLLADEPTGNLDSASGGQVMDLLCGLTETRRQTIVMVTHDPAHAARADRLILLRDGRVIAEPPTPQKRPTGLEQPDCYPAARSSHDVMDIHGPGGPATTRADPPHPPGNCHRGGGVHRHGCDDSQRASCLS